MVKSNKDLVFLLILVFWIIIDAMSLGYLGSDKTILITNPIMIGFVLLIVIIKSNSRRFNNWLNKDF